MAFRNIIATADYRDEEMNEYHVVALPETIMLDEIRMAQARILGETRLQQPLLITIARFIARERMEATLTRWIQNICNLQQSLTISLNNYSSQPPHTIYLRIQEAQPLLQLGSALKILDGFLQSNECAPLQLEKRPGLSIATHLSAGAYEKAMHNCSIETFHATITVSRLQLWKYNSSPGEMVNSFTLPPALAAAP